MQEALNLIVQMIPVFVSGVAITIIQFHLHYLASKEIWWHYIYLPFFKHRSDKNQLK